MRREADCGWLADRKKDEGRWRDVDGGMWMEG